MDDILEKIKEHKETIMSVAACAGVIGVGVATLFATLKSVKDLNYDKEIIEDNSKDALLKKAALCWRNYILSLGLIVITDGLIIASDISNKKKIETLTASYIFLSTLFSEYREQTIEKIGWEHESQVYSDALKGVETILSEECYDDEPKHGDDDILFVDTLTGNRFYARLAFVKEARYKLNLKYAYMGKASMYDFYDILGEDINEFDLYGDYAPSKNWNQMDAIDYEYAMIEMAFPLSTDYETGEVCREIVYAIDPAIDRDIPNATVTYEGSINGVPVIKKGA